jgi:hypothetical protein
MNAAAAGCGGKPFYRDRDAGLLQFANDYVVGWQSKREQDRIEMGQCKWVLNAGPGVL